MRRLDRLLTGNVSQFRRLPCIGGLGMLYVQQQPACAPAAASPGDRQLVSQVPPDRLQQAQAAIEALGVLPVQLQPTQQSGSSVSGARLIAEEAAAVNLSPRTNCRKI